VEFRKLDEQEEWYEGKCSNCAATLDIEYRAPRLGQEDVALLTDTARLQQRLRIAREKDPDRADLRVTSPLMVLDTLACYVRDCLEPKETHRAIPRLNRRFLLSFGEDCEPLLKKLEFVQTEETWQLPQPPPKDPWVFDLRKHLQDVQEELWALMRLHIQAPDQSKLKAYNEKPEAFDNDIQLLLSTIEYDKLRVVKRTPLLNQDEERWHAGLGSMGDFSDDLLLYAFDRQIAHDPVGTPYYYDCLTKLANKKQSETLEIKVMTLASEGYFGREDVAKAYKYFALDSWNAPNYTDEYIRDTFEARLGSVQSWQETEMRQMLRVIALSRGSRVLEGAAANGMLFFRILKVLSCFRLHLCHQKCTVCIQTHGMDIEQGPQHRD
jgi:ubiquitin carboxyl-terminal hydrolase 25